MYYNHKMDTLSPHPIYFYPITSISDPMTIGILTRDFEVYYEVIRILRSKDVSFYSITDGDHIPPYVSVILTTEKEAQEIQFKQLVTIGDDDDDDDVEAAVEKAINISQGKPVYDQLIIGIDPGKRPGIAVVGDCDVVNVYQAVSVSKVREFIQRVLNVYGFKSILVRVGNGAPSQRDRIINELLDMGLDVEVVDETSTTMGTEAPDIQAAISISFTKGKRTSKKKQVQPTPGEIKNLQRISRIESKGEVTISHDLAESVLKGELTLPEAIERHMNRSLD